MALSGSFSGSIRSGNYKLRIDWAATQNIANNTSKITAVMYLVQASGWSLNISSRDDNSTTIAGTTTQWTSPAISNGGGKTTKLATVTSGNIAHNADGTKTVTLSARFNIEATISGTYYSAITASTTITLNTIPRATQPTLSASSVNMGSAVTINLPRASGSFTHDLAYAFAGSGYKAITTGAGTSYSWIVPDLAADIPNAASGTVTVRCITKNGSTTVGTKTVLLTAKVPTSVVPTVSSVAVAETVSGLAAQFGAFIQNKSKIKATIAAAGAKGSTIKAYKATFDGKTYTASSWTSGLLTKSGTLPIKVQVQDSRGRWSDALTKNVSVLAYAAPKITTFRAYRADNTGAAQEDGTTAVILYAYSVTSLGGKNTAAATIEYKQAAATSYASNKLLTGSALSADTSLRVSSPEWSIDYEYDLRLTVKDWFGASTSYVASLPSGAVLIDIKADGSGIAFGATAQRSGAYFGFDAKGAVLGLGEATDTIPESANLNDYIKAGVYSVELNATAKTLVNRPSDNAGTMRVYSGVGNAMPATGFYYVMQEYRSYDPAETTYRRRGTRNSTGVWSFTAWRGIETGATAYGVASLA